MSNDQDEIPEDVRRELRRASGFGCCRCGFPVLQYHHIILNSVERHNRPEDMMVLCPTCHDMATKGAFLLDEQRRFQRAPYNLARGYSNGMLVTHQQYPAIQIGGVLIVGDGPIVVMDDEPILSFSCGDEGQMLLSAVLKNHGDEVLALIEHNEWIGSAAAWDLVADYQKLKINHQKNGIALRLDARGEPMQLRARFWHRGSLVDLRPTGVVWSGAGGMQNIGLAGIGLRIDSEAQRVDLFPHSEHAFLVSEPDALQRLIKTKNAYRDVLGKGKDRQS